MKPNIIDRNVRTDVRRIMTDAAVAYDAAMDKDFQKRHRVINHKETYVQGEVHTNTVESAFSLLKRGIVGSFHKISIKHLQRYLDEFSYRFNNRDNPELFSMTARKMTKTAGMPFEKLTSKLSA